MIVIYNANLNFKKYVQFAAPAAPYRHLLHELAWFYAARKACCMQKPHLASKACTRIKEAFKRHSTAAPSGASSLPAHTHTQGINCLELHVLEEQGMRYFREFERPRPGNLSGATGAFILRPRPQNCQQKIM